MNKIFSLFKNLLSDNDSNGNTIEFSDIERIAIDQSGSLGSFYDTSTDTITGKMRSHLKSQTFDLEGPIKCKIYKGCTYESQHLLKMVDIDHPLRMSIILKMIQPVGISSIINYPQIIDKYTRFLYFRYDTHIESCYNDWSDRISSKKISELATSTTCIITRIIRGIHAVVVLQLPPDQEDAIDQSLNQICTILSHTKDYIDITPMEKNLFDRIISTTVYSNIKALTKIDKVFEICKKIQKMKRHLDEHGPLYYTLAPIQTLNQEHHVMNTGFDECLTKDLENELLQQFLELRVLQSRLDNELSKLLQGKLDEQLNAAHESFAEIKQLNDNNMQQIRDLLKRLRENHDVLNDIKAIFNSDVQGTIQDYIHRLIISLDNLTSKGELIKQLQNDGFEYCNVVELGINQDSNERTLLDLLFKNNPKKIIFCATDNLKQQSPDQWNILYSQIVERRQKNSQLIVVYADFTYSTWGLDKMEIVSSKDQIISRCQSTSKAAFRRRERKPSLPLFKSTDDDINILLLGESGVGKSTFVNAFANYLRFDSLKQAQDGQPIVIIPVSFMMTVGDNFDERLIKFGEADPNENHNDIGQSVTQHCRSYFFEISPGKKLRIIDTPGFADTRGDTQDQINMNMIFTFVNNLTHLNAVCLLLKPNVTRLNPFLYSCFTEIFECFGEKIRDHLIFCFTTARSTFFVPGDTGPLLKAFFKSFPVTTIPFEKKNTFCFDNGSFRYLVALQNRLKFDQVEEDKVAKSWAQSVEEFRRLCNFLCERLHPYRQNLEWQSVENARFQIISIIRPVLEAIRNILRNILLHRTNSSLQLSASPLDRPAMICYILDRPLEKCGKFWIFSDYLISSSNVCAPDEQSPTEYRLNYEFVPDQTDQSLETLNKQTKFLIETCKKFARFLSRTETKENDPFLFGLIRMIKEEQFISHKHKQSTCNQQLADHLNLLKNEYERLLNTTNPCVADESLLNIYKLIVSVDDIPMVKRQIDAIKFYQQFILTSNEHNVQEQETRF